MSKTGRDKIIEPVGEVRLKPCLGGEKGSCVICGARSKTVLMVDGGAEALFLALLWLGLTKRAVEMLFEKELGATRGTAPVGEGRWMVRVCKDCAADVGWRVADPKTGRVPCYSLGSWARGCSPKDNGEQ